MGAREEAEKWLRDEAERLTRHAGPSWRAGYGDGFHDGLAWAVEESAVRVEAIAQAVYENGIDVYNRPSWEEIAELQREVWREDIRLVLSALRHEQQS